MSTVILLKCTECGKNFEKNKHEVSRRKYKTNSTNWFCTRSCSASYGNRVSPHPPKPYYGNKNNQKYDPLFSWYLQRIKKDVRKHALFEGNITTMYNHLKDIWTGICAISNVPLVRRDLHGKCDETNPFFTASIDRIDSNKPYQVGNVQWVSTALNQAKSNVSDSIFREQYAKFLSFLSI